MQSSQASSSKAGFFTGKATSSTNSSQVTGRLNKELLDLIKPGIAEAKKAAGKDLVVFLGTTGTGKSTVVNYLAGREMERKLLHEDDINDVICVKGNKEIAKIGHKGAISETLYATIYDLNEIGLTLCDCGGSKDSRGVNADITVALSTKMTIENAASVKLVLCISYSELGARASGLREILEQTLCRLLGDYNLHPNSIAFLITKPYGSNGIISSEKMRKQLLKDLKELKEEELKKREEPNNKADNHIIIKLYEFLTRENGKYIYTCDPMDSSRRSELIDFLKSMKPMNNTQALVQVAYSSAAQVTLLETLVTIAATGAQLFEKYFNATANLNTCQRECSSLAENIQKIEANMAALSKKDGSKLTPEKLKETKDKMIKDYSERIEQIKQDIVRIEYEANNIQLNMASKRDAVEKAAYEEESLYWADEIIETAKMRTEYKVVEKAREEKTQGGILEVSDVFGRVLGYLPIAGQSRQVVDKDIETTQVGDVLTHTFKYQGPEISRVEKEAVSGTWSNENQQTSSYSIKFLSAPGEAANARVNIYVKNKHNPTFMTGINHQLSLNALEQDKQIQLNLTLSEKKDEIRNLERLIERSDHLLERLNEFQENLDDYKGQQAVLQSKQKDYEKEIQALQTQINSEKDNCDFLKEYLHLSRDTRLEKNNVIADFLIHEKQYSKMSNPAMRLVYN